jgi:hypothetical protein
MVQAQDPDLACRSGMTLGPRRTSRRRPVGIRLVQDGRITLCVVASALAVLVSFDRTPSAASLVCTLKTDSIMTIPGKDDEFFALMEAKRSTEAARCCLACLPKAGTTVVMVDQGFASHTVRVIDGEHKDCVGDIATEALDCSREGETASSRSALGPRDAEVCVATQSGSLRRQDVACSFAAGGHLVVTDRGYFSSTVTVAGTASCSGDVSNSVLADCSRQPTEVDYNAFYSKYRASDDGVRGQLRADLKGRTISGIAELWNTKQRPLSRCGTDIVNPGATSFPDCTMFRLSSPNDPSPGGRGPISIVVPGDQRETWGPRLRFAGTKVKFAGCRVLDVQDWFEFPMIVCEAPKPPVQYAETLGIDPGRLSDIEETTPPIATAVPSATATEQKPVSAKSEVLGRAIHVLENTSFSCAVMAGAGSARFAEEGFALTDGTFRGPRIEGSHEQPEARLEADAVAVGDLDDDGRIDAAAPIYEFGSGTGVFWTLYVVRDVFGDPRCTHAIFLGDRVKIERVEIQPPGSVIVDMLDHGPTEAMAQATSPTTRKFTLAPDGLVAHERRPGTEWSTYRRDQWVVNERRGSANVQPAGDSLGDDDAARTVRKIVTLLADGPSDEVSAQLAHLQSLPKPQRGNRSRARGSNDLGLQDVQAGNYPEAIKLFREAYEVDPADPEVLNNLAYALLLSGDAVGAVPVLVKTLTVAPRRGMAWETLGQVLAALGETGSPVGAFRASVEVSSDRDRARQRLVRVAEKSPNPAVSEAIRSSLSERQGRAENQSPTIGVETDRAPKNTYEDSDATAAQARDESDGSTPLERSNPSSTAPSSAAGRPLEPTAGADSTAWSGAIESFTHRNTKKNPHPCAVIKASDADTWVVRVKHHDQIENITFTSQAVGAVGQYTEGCICAAALREFLQRMEVCLAAYPPARQVQERSRRRPQCVLDAEAELARHHNVPATLVALLGGREAGPAERVECPPFHSACSTGCCPPKSHCCWGQGGTCCPEGHQCCVNGGCCPSGTRCTNDGCR